MKVVHIDKQKELQISDDQQVIIFDVCDEKQSSSLEILSIGENVKAEYIFFVTDKGTVPDMVHKTIQVGKNSHLLVRFCIFTKQTFELVTTIHVQEKSQVDHETCINVFESGNVSVKEQYIFHKEEAQANFYMKLLAFDQAKIKALGNIVIDKGAQRVDSQLDLHGFLLSPQAQISLIPQLEIQANDVKASHSAKTESIDADTLFYLQSRGLSFSQATKLFLEGLMMEHISSISNNDVRKYIESVAHETILKRYE